MNRVIHHKILTDIINRRVVPVEKLNTITDRILPEYLAIFINELVQRREYRGIPIFLRTFTMFEFYPTSPYEYFLMSETIQSIGFSYSWMRAIALNRNIRVVTNDVELANILEAENLLYDLLV